MSFGLIGTYLFPISEGFENALGWTYFESILPWRALWWFWVIDSFANVITLFLFCCLVPWSRWLFLGLTILSVVMTLLSGLYVTTPIPDFFSLLGATIFWFPFVLSFFPPCSNYFQKRVEQGAGASGGASISEGKRE